MIGAQQNKASAFGFGAFGQSSGFREPQKSVFGQISTCGAPAAKSGGLFGRSTSTFGATQQPQQTQPIFGSTQSITQTTIFGQPQQNQTQNNVFGTPAFGTQKRSSFEGFGTTATSTIGTGLFGQQKTITGSLLGQPSTDNNVSGQSTFGAAAPSGTSVPFKATTGTEIITKDGISKNLQMQYQCITCMKEYENKSFEELRVDDYLADRKYGNQTQTNTFGAVSTSSTGSLFGQMNTITNTGVAFGNNNQPKLLGAGAGFGTPTPQPFGEPKAFGTATPGSGAAAATLFGTTTSQATQAVSFGTPTFNTSSFGNRFGTTTSTPGTTNTTSPTFNPGPTTASHSNNIFGTAPATTTAPFSFSTPTTGTMFSAESTTGTQPLGGFGNTSLGSTSGFFRSLSTTGLGGQTQPSNVQDEIARNRQRILMISLPLGGGPFLRCEVKKDPIRPTSLAAQKSVLDRTVKPFSPPAPKPKVIPISRSSSLASLFAGLEDSDTTALGPSPMILTIKPKMPECFNTPSIFQPATPRNTSIEADKAPEPAKIVQLPVEEANPSSPPIHSTPYNAKTRLRSPLRQEMNATPEDESSLQLASEKSILRAGEEPSPENENTIGVKCARHDYYTKPPLNTLKLDRNGDCFVENFVIGRKDFGSMVVLGKMNVANLDIDGTVLFRRKEIEVYPDESNKPPVGQGLNRNAEVTLEAVYPLNRGTRDVMKDPKQLIDSKFREKLESHTVKMGATFLDYDEYTGVWVFRVNHFSRYGLLDDVDDEQANTDVHEQIRIIL